MKRLLVTGATGFVGTTLRSKARAEGWLVRAAVRQGHGPEIVSVGEIDAGTDWAEAMEGVQVVIHLAGRAHVMGDDSIGSSAYYRVNVDGTRRLAESAAGAGVERIVFLSSIKVNGEETGDAPFTEESQPSPEDDYGRSKWQAEQVLGDVANTNPLSVVVVRSPLVHGPNVKGNLLRLMKAIQRGRPLPFGAIDNRRSLVGIENLTDLLLLCATHDRASGELYLAADSEDISTPGIVRELAAGLGRTARLLAVPVPILRVAGASLRRTATIRRVAGNLQISIEKARNQLGWTPRVTVEEGLRATARAFAGPLQ